MQDKENSSFEYASVYLLDNPYCIDTAYDYFIPLEMRGQIAPGSFVTVPFGRGNRKNMAVVWGLTHCPSYKDVKPVDSVCLDRLPLDGDALAVCDFMKSQYLCTIGEAVRCAVPASVLGKMSEYYYPIPSKSVGVTSGLSPADLFVYDYISSFGGRLGESVKAKFGAAVADGAIERLMSAGLIGKELTAGKVIGNSVKKYYSLAVSYRECADILEGKAATKLRSPLQKSVLGALLHAEGEIEQEALCRECSVGASQLKALLDKGLISVNAKREWRDGYMTDARRDGDRVEYVLNDEQARAADELNGYIEEGKARGVLLFGVTGSGKTSVIISAIDKTLELGKGVIMLLPEIALTPQTLRIFGQRYGRRIAVVHSGLSAGERSDSYARIRSGEADVVLGTRSAIFAPVKDLGLVIIDEEHETTYKSDTSPKYHARDIARFRCVRNGAVMLLASATPSMESYSKAMSGKYSLIRLCERYGGAQLPEVRIYDMRREAACGNTSPLGSLLKEELVKTVERGEQAILFLNRRGYSTSVSCKSCGETLVCPHCSISLNYHTKKGTYERGFLFCHWCGYKTDMPRVCPSCSSEHLARIGFGTQKIEQELEALLPTKRILRMDADSTAGKNSLNEILSKFKNGEGDVLLGTQMVTKGHDFPNVTLVGVLLADMSMYMDDYHANERTFSMLTQVIGRAGRSGKDGTAIIQTNNPDSDTIKLACSQDYEAFYMSEIRLRKLLTFPPYCDIVLMTVMSSDEKQAILWAKRLREEIDRHIKSDFSDIKTVIYGPFEAPAYKVEEKYRMRIVIKCILNRRSRELFSVLLSDFGKNNKSKTALSVNFNPTGL